MNIITTPIANNALTVVMTLTIKSGSGLSPRLFHPVPISKNGLICNALGFLVTGMRNLTAPNMPLSDTNWFCRYPLTVSTPPMLNFSRDSSASGVN